MAICLYWAPLLQMGQLSLFILTSTDMLWALILPLLLAGHQHDGCMSVCRVSDSHGTE